MEHKEKIQEMYRITKEIANNDTALIYKFLKGLHEEKGEAHYLLDMPDLTIVERKMIESIINEK